MQKYRDVVQSISGQAIGGASVLVKTLAGATATIYSDNGVTPTANPLTTDSSGVFSFYAADGRYSLTISGTGITTQIITDILLEDPADGSAALSASSGSSLVGFIQSDTNAIARTLQDKGREARSVADYATPALADANGGVLVVPAGTTTTSVATGAALNSSYRGDGQIVTADGNKRGKFFNAVKAAPAALGNENNLDLAFNGDLSKSTFQVEHRITGAATAGQPTSGYSYRPEIFPNYTYLFNTSGWNDSTSGNNGRTGIAAYRAKIAHYGQGDVFSYNGSVLVVGTKAGSTSYLANPAGALFGGDVSAAADGVYLDVYETVAVDNGYDVAAAGNVNNLRRRNSTGAKYAWWCGYRLQSIGTESIDVGFSAVGLMNIGIDLSFVTLPTSGSYQAAAITMKAGQRIYGNATATDASGISRYPSSLGTGEYFNYESGLAAWSFVVGNVSAFQIYANQVVTTQNLLVATAGKGLRVKEGLNAKQGTATLVAGSVVVSNTSVTASSRIFLTSNTDGGTPGWLRVSARSAGTSFTITSSSGTDTSTVAYQIFEPA